MRHVARSIAHLHQSGSPPDPRPSSLQESGLPRGDVHLDLTRLMRLAVEAIGALSDEELADRVGAPLAFAPALRGARDLREATETAVALKTAPGAAASPSPETLTRFRELRERA